MKPFLVIALGRFLKENSVDLAFASFSKFYHSVTFKYQKNSRLIVIDKDYNHILNKDLAAQFSVEDKTSFLSLADQDEVEKCYREGTLLLLTRNINSSSIIREAFLYGLPVIGFSNSGHDNLLDTSNSLSVDFRTDHQAVSDFANNLRLLKYDPEAVKMLQKGATKRYNSEFTFSQRKGA